MPFATTGTNNGQHQHYERFCPYLKVIKPATNINDIIKFSNDMLLVMLHLLTNSKMLPNLAE